MSTGFAKLDGGIVDSTLWMEPDDVLRVWVYFLAKADRRGVVRSSVPAIAHQCQKSIERVEEILAKLQSPDPYSRSSVDDGRRLRSVEGGWQMVNYLTYRNTRDDDARRDQQREWDRQNRPSGHARQQDTVRPQSDSPTRSDTVRHGPTYAEAEAEAEEKDQEQFAPPDSRAVPPDRSAAFLLPLNTGVEHPITEAQVREFSDLYPSVDVPQALRCMRGWLVSNPANRKTRSGILRFVNRWLAKEQNEAQPGRRGKNGARDQDGEGIVDRAAERARRISERTGVSLE